MAKSLCRLLIYVNHALVAILKWKVCPIVLFAKIEFARKCQNLQYAETLSSRLD